MDELIKSLSGSYPDVRFSAGDVCRWSPKHGSITYIADDSPTNQWGILHELGHALLGHDSYRSDIELLQKEVAAWEKACQLARTYDLKIPEEHIQDCLDTYRDWLARRSACPLCGAQTASLQNSTNTYQCFNCHTTWTVSAAHPYHRVYRRSKNRPTLG
jgi:IrrE N-terminal-like domain